MVEIRVGTRQGLIHSGEVVDSALYWKAECEWASADNLAQHRIDGFWRFRDDGLMLARNSLQMLMHFTATRAGRSDKFEGSRSSVTPSKDFNVIARP